MINYNKLAREYIMGVIMGEAEDFAQKFTLVEESMKVDHGNNFDMLEFIEQLNNVENMINDFLLGDDKQ